MNWDGNYYAESPEFGNYDTYTSVNPMSDPLLYDQTSDGQYYGDIHTPPELNFEVSKMSPSHERRPSGDPASSYPVSERRASGNNPYGSRGCASCVPCRKRKGKCLYKHRNDVCDFCQKYGHPCGLKVTKAEFGRLISGKPAPPLRYSSVVHELEREFPQSPPDSIHEMAGKRLKEMMESRDRVMNAVPTDPPSFADSASLPAKSRKRRFKEPV